MTIFMITQVSDDWFDSWERMMPEVGYFDTESDAQAWIDSGDYVQGLYDEEVREIHEANEELRVKHEALAADWEKLKAAGLSHLMNDPGEFRSYPVQSFEDFAEHYRFKVVSVEKA